MSTETLLGRPPQRTEHIVQELRGQITRGDLRPGVQLPTRVEIEQTFGASSVTVQRALQQLQRDGFVTVNGRQGTFVSDTPPHLTNYALVFPTLPGEGHWNRFFAALSHEAPRLTHQMGRQISIYYGADGHVQHADYRRLVEDVKAHRLGGIIFASVPYLLEGTPVLEETRLPRVAIMAPSQPYDMPRIVLDPKTMQQRCAETLIKRGRRNLALVMPPRTPDEVEEFHRGMIDHGFHIPPQWVQFASRDYPQYAANLTHLLFENGRNRPDALFITDDNLVEHALAGLIAAGANVPADVEIVAHCNFPYPVPAPVPVRRLGYDARRILKAGFDSLDGQRAGETVPSVTTISAQFEEEVNAG